MHTRQILYATAILGGTTFTGAGHGFTRSQEARDGANRRAVEQAWPLTVSWFREHLGDRP